MPANMFVVLSEHSGAVFGSKLAFCRMFFRSELLCFLSDFEEDFIKPMTMSTALST